MFLKSFASYQILKAYFDIKTALFSPFIFLLSAFKVNALNP
jgi:hypothetical protein